MDEAELDRSRTARIAGTLFFFLLTSCFPAVSPQPGTVVMALDEGPQNLDPRIGTDATSERLIQILFSSLVKRSRDFSIEPDLALSWDIPDPLTYVFHLRDDATFHDGRPVTARDVVFTFRSLLDGSISTPKAGTFRLVESVKALDDRTVVFKLKEPFAPFLWNLTRGGVGIVPEGSPPDFARSPIGSGPFRFVRFIPDGEVVIARNDGYYGPRPKVSEVRLKIIPEAIVRALEIRKGSVDIAMDSLPPDMVEALRGNDNVDTLQAPGTNYQYVAFNLKDPAFSDVRVRRAIAHAIDRAKIVEFLFRNQARLATGVIPPNNWSYAGDVAQYPFDPERARQLLKEAGHADLAFTFRTSTDETTKLLVAVFQQQLREVGVRMDIRSNEPATFAADIEKGNFQMFSRRWIGGNNDPDIFNLIFHSTMTPPNGANRTFYFNAEVDRLVELGRREVDQEKRKVAYQTIQRIVADELPYISLWYMDNVVIYNKRVSGMTLYPAGEYDFLADIEVSAR
jgi:peptide/nickel transport system substrate-binding protein